MLQNTTLNAHKLEVKMLGFARVLANGKCNGKC